MAASIDPELLEAFLAESSDVLEQCEKTLLDLERQPRNAGAHASLLRNFHTLKGAAAAVGLAEVSTHVHHGESLLQVVKSGVVKIEANRLVDFLFRFNDSVKALIAEACGSTDAEHRIIRDVGTEIAGLESPPAAPERRDAAVHPAKRPAEAQPANDAAAEAADSDVQDSDPAILRVPAARIDALMQRAGELLAQRSRLEN